MRKKPWHHSAQLNKLFFKTPLFFSATGLSQTTIGDFPDDHSKPIASVTVQAKSSSSISVTHEAWKYSTEACK